MRQKSWLQTVCGLRELRLSALAAVVIKGVKSQVSSLKLIHRRQLVKKETLLTATAPAFCASISFWGRMMVRSLVLKPFAAFFSLLIIGLANSFDNKRVYYNGTWCVERSVSGCPWTGGSFVDSMGATQTWDIANNDVDKATLRKCVAQTLGTSFAVSSAPGGACRNATECMPNCVLNPVRHATLFTWGDGGAGRIGQGDNYEKLSPLVLDVSYDYKFVKIYAMDYHGYALTDGGLVFSWGLADFGRLGTTDLSVMTEASLATPTLVATWFEFNYDNASKVETRRPIVKTLYCGPEYVIALTGDRRLFSWGAARYGTIGHGDLPTDSTGGKTYGMTDFGQPMRLEARHPAYPPSIAMSNGVAIWSKRPHALKNVIRVFLNWNVAYAHTDIGLYSWGTGWGGILGHGDADTRFTPTPVCSSMKCTSRDSCLTCAAQWGPRTDGVSYTAGSMDTYVTADSARSYNGATGTSTLASTGLSRIESMRFIDSAEPYNTAADGGATRLCADSAAECKPAGGTQEIIDGITEAGYPFQHYGADMTTRKNLPVVDFHTTTGICDVTLSVASTQVKALGQQLYNVFCKGTDANLNSNHEKRRDDFLATDESPATQTTFESSRDMRMPFGDYNFEMLLFRDLVTKDFYTMALSRACSDSYDTCYQASEYGKIRPDGSLTSVDFSAAGGFDVTEGTGIWQAMGTGDPAHYMDEIQNYGGEVMSWGSGKFYQPYGSDECANGRCGYGRLGVSLFREEGSFVKDDAGVVDPQTNWKLNTSILAKILPARVYTNFTSAAKDRKTQYDEFLYRNIRLSKVEKVYLSDNYALAVTSVNYPLVTPNGNDLGDYEQDKYQTYQHQLLYGWGDGQFYVLGTNDQMEYSTPRIIAMPGVWEAEGGHSINFCSGLTEDLCRAEGGSCTWNPGTEDCDLDIHLVYQFTRIYANRHTVHVVANALANDGVENQLTSCVKFCGMVFTWGIGYDYTLGLGNDENAMHPKAIPYFANVQRLFIASDFVISLGLCAPCGAECSSTGCNTASGGILHSWGFLERKTLGLLDSAITGYDENTYYVSTPTRIPTGRFRTNSIPADQLVKAGAVNKTHPRQQDLVDPFRLFYPNGKPIFESRPLDHISHVYFTDDYVIATRSMPGNHDYANGRYLGVRCGSNAQCQSGRCDTGASHVCIAACYGRSAGVCSSNPQCTFSAFDQSCTDKCENGLFDSGETDVDCGGNQCDACSNGLECNQNSDCSSDVCEIQYTLPDEGDLTKAIPNGRCAFGARAFSWGSGQQATLGHGPNFAEEGWKYSLLGPPNIGPPLVDQYARTEAFELKTEPHGPPGLTCTRIMNATQAFSRYGAYSGDYNRHISDGNKPGGDEGCTVDFIWILPRDYSNATYTTPINDLGDTPLTQPSPNYEAFDSDNCAVDDTDCTGAYLSDVMEPKEVVFYKGVTPHGYEWSKDEVLSDIQFGSNWAMAVSCSKFADTVNCAPPCDPKTSVPICQELKCQSKYGCSCNEPCLTDGFHKSCEVPPVAASGVREDWPIPNGGTDYPSAESAAFLNEGFRQPPYCGDKNLDPDNDDASMCWKTRRREYYMWSCPNISMTQADRPAP